MYDVIIIGAGPSGIFCAITASKNGKKVLLIEKNDDIGKKFRLTGGGRCNITNLKDVNDFIKNLPVNNGRFLYSALTNFNPHNIYNYFDKLGVPLKVEKDDKVFPVSDKSMDFINALRKQLENNHVDIKLNCEVLDIDIKDDYKIVKTTQKDFQTNNVVIATGGKSYPHTGSTGIGYILAEKLNHHITELFPTESPIISHDPLINSKVLQGLSFENVKLTLVDENQKVIKSHQHDLIITHFGLSGPAALKLSQFIYHYLKTSKEATLLLDIVPEIKYEDLIINLKNKREKHASKSFKNVVKDLLPNRFLDYLLNMLNIDESTKMADINNKTLNDFANSLKNFTIKVHEIKPIQSAFVTGGGVSLKDINPKTMESKIVQGLYFTGEVLDLHGYTGGYNITIAITTGYTAGISIS